MPTIPFISTDRIKQHLPNFDESDDIILKDILDGVLAFTKRYTGRNLVAATYYEQHDTDELGFFQLAQRPVNSVIRVASSASVLSIQNTTAQRATVGVNDTGVVLQSATSGTPATTTVPFASNATLSAMATAISAVGGWTCSVVGDYGSHESNTLARIGGQPCLQPFTLNGFVTDLAFVFQSPATIIVPRWIGLATTRCDYTAGWSVCPDDLAQAIAELCSITYRCRNLDPNFASYSNGAYSWSKGVAQGFDQLSAPSRKTLALYRVPRLGGSHLV